MRTVRIFEVLVAASLLLTSISAVPAEIPSVGENVITGHRAPAVASPRELSTARSTRGVIPTFAIDDLHRLPETTSKEVEAINVALRFGPGERRYDFLQADQTSTERVSAEDRFGLSLPQPMRGAGVFATLALVVFFFARRLS